jgi:hypothetical protein
MQAKETEIGFAQSRIEKRKVVDADGDLQPSGAQRQTGQYDYDKEVLWLKKYF